MLGRRPEKESQVQSNKRKRAWEENGDNPDIDEDDQPAEADVTVTAKELEEWRQREKLEEANDEVVQESQQQQQQRQQAVLLESLLARRSRTPSPQRRRGEFAEAPPNGFAANPARTLGGLPGLSVPSPPGALAVLPPPGFQAPAAQPMPPMGCLMPAAAPRPGLRLGESDDRGRSYDEIRIIKEMLAEEIQQFIVDNRIDAPAARDLRVEPVHVQFAILDRGPLTSCVNPSGALIGRIRDAKKGVRHGAQGGGAPSSIHQSLQTQMPAAGPPGGAPGQMLAGPAALGASGDIERFILENRLDQGAATSLRTEPPDIRDKVVAMGPLVNAVNPSAAMMGRIRSVRLGVQNYGGGPGAPGPASVGTAPGQSPPMLAAPFGMSVDFMGRPLAGQSSPRPPVLSISNGVSQDARQAAPGPVAAGGHEQEISAQSAEDQRLNNESMKAIAALQADFGAGINKDDL